MIKGLRLDWSVGDASAKVAEALRLQTEGLSQRHIAKTIGKSRHWVRYQLGQSATISDGSQSTRPLAEICVGTRTRKDNGDIEALARSIDANGLMHPIVITPAGSLIAGRRRMLAWPLTKFRDQGIPVRVLDLDQITRGEFAENADRKDFLPSEIDAIRRALEPIERAAAKERQGSRNDLRESFPEVGGRRRDRIGTFAGISGRTVEKIAKVVAAAEAEPEKYGRLVEAMDKTGRVNGPFKRLQVLKQTESLRVAPPPMPMRGPYECLVIDYPWPHEPGDESPAERGRATRPYPAMSLTQGRAMPVPSILAENCRVWMWVTNFHMRYAYELLDAWGLTSTPTILTWVKDKMGRGQILRDKTEHCIVGTRGNPVFNLTNQTTELRAPRREHSRKPDELYLMVEQLCPAPIYAELFSRGGRGPNWDCHGDQIGKFASVPGLEAPPGRAVA
jgi:N6-adenosine-specific RNA methylase IME4